MGAHGFCIVPAAGIGKRMGSDTKKQYLKLSGTPILVRTLQALSACEAVDGIVLVCPMDDALYLIKIVKKYKLSKVCAITGGGDTRQESVEHGLRVLPQTDLVCIHDGVRPFVTSALLEASFEAAATYGACVVGLPVTNTVKRVSAEGFVEETPVRSTLYAAQTPQTFRTSVLKAAYEAAAAAGDYSLTDDAQVVEKYGSVPVKLIPGEIDNIKITTPADLVLGKNILQKRQVL